MKTSTLIGIAIMAVVLSVGISLFLLVKPVPDVPIATEVVVPQDLPTTLPAVTTATPMLSSQNDPLLGNYMVAQNGMTLYLYTKDGAGKTNCTDACAELWPPYTVAEVGDISVGAGVGGRVATTVRADGKIQLTYNGMPLHFYSKDEKVGDMKGQNLDGVWFMVKP